MTDCETPKLKEEKHIAFHSGRTLFAMVGGSASNEDIANLIFTRSTQHFRFALDAVCRIMTRLIVANGNYIGTNFGQS